jgi:Flp pilus assembly protein TadB
VNSAVVVTSLLTAAAAAGLVRLVVPVPKRLAGRVRPYTVAARTSLGRPADVGPSAFDGGDGSVARRLLAPVLGPMAAALGRLLDGRSDDALALRLRQAGMYQDVPAGSAATEYRFKALTALLVGAGAGGAAGLALGQSFAAIAALVIAGGVAGAARVRGALDSRLEDRRERMRIELYTVNHLLAMHLRVGGGVVQACRSLVERGNGLVIDELADALRLHQSGLSVREAFTRAARATAEPSAARTYRLLAAGSEHGSDLADALLGHADDIRTARREALKRQATRRRAGMLLPIVGVLAPVMLLFIAAPIPSIIFGVQ